jgi:hypothetical protein
MGNIVYLLGAGASAQAIPVVDGMEVEIEKDKEYINRKLKSATLAQSILEELQIACSNHSSIDTYAKKLYLTNQKEFESLKFKLSFYFTLRQIIKPLDKRYDNFWASVIEKSDTLPSNIKILSWNYDFQLEQSYSGMSSNNSLTSARTALNINHLGEYNAAREFSVIKLNGSATISDYFGNIMYFYEGSPTQSFKEKYHLLETAYNGAGSDHKSNLKFAWETTPDIIQLQNLLNGCDVLVVIGYSFPVFNRKIDQLVLNLLILKGTLKHIYIQDVDPEAIFERMQEIAPLHATKITYKKDLRQFTFPIEL